MLDRDTIVQFPHEIGVKRGDPPLDPRVSVSMKTEGVELVLFFADLGGEGDVLEARVLPDTASVTPATIGYIGRRFALHVSYARAAIQWNEGAVRDALSSLRVSGRTSRGLSADFYRAVAVEYDALVRAGEPHPVKALALANSVTISAASRWITEAKRRGLVLPPTTPPSA